VSQFKNAIRGDTEDTHVQYTAANGKDAWMKIEEMANKLADQNIGPPMQRDQDNRLRSKETTGEAESVEALAAENPQLAREGRLAKLVRRHTCARAPFF